MTMPGQSREQESLHVVLLADDADGVLDAVHRLNRPVVIHRNADVLGRLANEPLVLVMDERSAAPGLPGPVRATPHGDATLLEDRAGAAGAGLADLSALGDRVAETVAVVGGLTERGEAALMEAGIEEVLDRAEVTAQALGRALNRARLRQMLRHDAHQARNVAHALLDRMPLAVIFGRADGHIVHANARARALLESGRALVRAGDGTVAAVHGEDTRRLREVIRTVAGGGDPEGALAIRPAEDDGAQVSVIVVPAGPATAEAPTTNKRGVALFIADPDAAIAIDEGRLSALYGLTRSEAHILARLSAGLTLDEIAAERGQKAITARGQLKTIFRKTGTRRQSEVIKLVLSGPALISSA